MNRRTIQKNRRKLNGPRIIPKVYEKRKILVAASRAENEQKSIGSEKDKLNDLFEDDDDEDFKEIVLGDTHAALLLITSQFPQEAYEYRIPPVALRHHLYSIVKSRTTVDQELNDLLNRGEIVLFNLANANDDFALIIKSEFVSYIRNRVMKTVNEKYHAVIEKFIEKILPENSPNLSYKKLTTKFGFSEEDLTNLVHCGLIVFHNAKTYWLSVPNIGPFIIEITKGRQEIINMIKRNKHKEMLVSEILNKKLRKTRLSVRFHVDELSGTDMVESIDTACGPLLRLKIKK